MNRVDHVHRLHTAGLEEAARRTHAARVALTAIQVTMGLTGLIGGLLLVIRSDGSLLRADPDVLAGTPFGDWRVPGLLLAVLVGCGFLLTAWWTWRSYPYSRALSVFAGAGLIAFEAAELGWLGFQPLEAIIAVIGLVTITLASLVPATTDPSVGRSHGDDIA